MRAAQFVAAGAPLRLVDLPDPERGDDDVVVRVRAVGLCGSDLHILQGHTPTAFTPIILGHEISGVVEEVPAGAAVSVGDHVFVNPMTGCGRCVACAGADRALCEDREILGIQRDGGLAERLVVPAANVTAVDRSLAFSEIALIESAGTANRAVRALLPVSGETVLVIGTGGLGLQAVRIALAHGAEVVALDTDATARERSLDAGARAALDPSDPALADRIRVLAGERGVCGAIDCVGIPRTFDTALRALRRGGLCVVIGIGDVALALTPPAHFLRRGLRVSAAYGYAERDIADVVARVQDGSLDLSASVSAVLPLEQVNAGLEAFAARTGSPTRVVIEL